MSGHILPSREAQPFGTLANLNGSRAVVGRPFGMVSHSSAVALTPLHREHAQECGH